MQSWTDDELSLTPLTEKTVAIVGYGNQGRSQALNLRDSGIAVVVGARPGGQSWHTAETDGFTVLPVEAIPQHAEVIAVLTPDDQIGPILNNWVADNQLTDQHTIIVGHGLSFHAGWATAPDDVAAGLVAPKGQGKGVRDKYLAGSGVPGLIGTHQPGAQGEVETLATLQAYAKAIGCGHGGVYLSSIREETVCDLFSEQAVLCGGLSHLITAAFETLVSRGYSAEAAAIECQYEVKLIADLLHTQGMAALRQAISPAALYGDLSRGPRIVDDHVKATLNTLLDEIEDGTFAAEMAQRTTSQLRAQAAQASHPQLEATYQQLRRRMNGLSTPKLPDPIALK